MMNKDTEKLLKNLYYNISSEGGLSSAAKLYKSARLYSPTITLNEVKRWLQGEVTYTLHKQARKMFIRNPVICSSIDEQWQADLVDMQEFRTQNNGNGYILTVIDIFSKYAWAVPVKRKTAIEVLKAFKTILTQRKPFKIQTDQGKEFKNTQMQNFFKQNDIIHFFAKTDVKCSIVERFNRTLKTRMFKYFTAKGTRKYIDVLDDLVFAYNNSTHRTIKKKPADVTDDNTNEVFYNTYKKLTKRELLLEKCKRKMLSPGDMVRQKYKLKPFDKGYYPNWTDQTFEITLAKKLQKQPLYKLDKGDKSFYPEEVQKITPIEYRVEKIIKRKKVRGKIHYLVKWLNYPDSNNSWVSAEHIRNL